ncbi:hypothetical protein [Cellulomonas sp. PhB143]|uniref:hypothetical protein n=1 Tax=Cellulomonas sp. PhB143 TaxID=2485186 RepID=UPI000F462E02|nr:hypothetical protein [Cellulomonas sp. PhB143]ROS79056.1 hypothetical protein EDF32_0102 [Cellulomonas sp. PhB143]
MATIDEAREAKEALRASLADRAGIAGVGIAPADGAAGDAVREPVDPGDAGAVDYVLQVNVESATMTDGLPPQVHGVAVRVRVVGRIEPQEQPELGPDPDPDR